MTPEQQFWLQQQQFWLQMVTVILAALTPILLILVNQRVSKVATKVEEVHTNTNSMKDQLVAVTRTASHAEGKLEGIAQADADSTPTPEVQKVQVVNQPGAPIAVTDKTKRT